jgi:D-amino peptidase
MKVYISVDMEGISGVVAREHVDTEHKEYERFRRLMTGDANAAIRGAFEGGATEVVVNDAHSSMHNLLIEELHPSATLISGSPKPLSMMEGIAEGADMAFFVGYHARAGTAQGILDHTWSGFVQDVYLNNRAVGEIGINAALAGHYGVPIALVTGDRATTEEAQALLGGVETVAVKAGVGRTAARCLPVELSHTRIAQAAQRAVARPGQPFVIEPPIALAVEFARTFQAELAALAPGVERTSGRRVEWTGDDVPTVYRTWRALVTLAGVG